MPGLIGLSNPELETRLVPASGKTAWPDGELDCGASADWTEAPLQPAMNTTAATSANMRIIPETSAVRVAKWTTPYTLPVHGQRAVKIRDAAAVSHIPNV
jgi:hypothetical protein